MPDTHVEPPLPKKMRTGPNVNITGLLAVGNLLAATLAWIGYARTGDAAAGVPAGALTVLCVISGAAHFHERIRALERTVAELRTGQE